MEWVSENESVVSESDKIVSEIDQIVSEYHGVVVSEYWEIVSESDKIVSESDQIVSFAACSFRIRHPVSESGVEFLNPTSIMLGSSHLVAG
jgi:hypothetical protein